MIAGLVGPSYQQRSIPYDAQRTINLYAVKDEMGKQPTALYGTPGLLLNATAGSGPNRGCYTTADERCFFVSGSGLYEVNNVGVATLRGSLKTSTGNVSLTDNGISLALCDGVNGYTLTLETNDFSQITDPDFPLSGTITFIDGYFVVNQNDTGTFYISELYAGSSWEALEFATAESSPDRLLRVFNAVGQLWLFGEKTTEVWTNAGNLNFPFRRISGGKMEAGILAPHTAVAVDNSVIWLGRDSFGQGMVYRASGVQPTKISTEAIDYAIQKAGNLSECQGYAYQQDGHVFYVLTGGGLETSLVYDISTDLWHERAYRNESGEYELHLGSCCTFAFGKHLVGDRRNGKIYEMSQNYFSDNGAEIVADRTFPHLSKENQYLKISSLEIDMETGVGNEDAPDPQIILQISKDGGRTWSSEMSGSIGRVGEYLTRVSFRCLGMARQWTFKVKISDPVKRALIGVYIK